MPSRPTVVWRRLDIDGRELATVHQTARGWHISGVAEFREAAGSSCLAYIIQCTAAWETCDCQITGFIRDTPVNVSVHRDGRARWTLDGAPIDAVTGCIDIDLSFSPVTNLLPIRRLELDRGKRAHVRAAWLRFPEMTLEILDQTYTRIARHSYHYESGGGAFKRDLTVDSDGLIVAYPGLWTAIQSRP